MAVWRPHREDCTRRLVRRPSWCICSGPQDGATVPPVSERPGRAAGRSSNSNRVKETNCEPSAGGEELPSRFTRWEPYPKYGTRLGAQEESRRTRRILRIEDRASVPTHQRKHRQLEGLAVIFRPRAGRMTASKASSGAASAAAKYVARRHHLAPSDKAQGALHCRNHRGCMAVSD
jgi:hypothetical protein